MSTPFDRALHNGYHFGVNWFDIVRNGNHLPHDIQERLIAIIDELPHGSGIDSDWCYYETKGYHCLTNSYHCMNKNGYYDGWMDFTVKMPKSIFNDADRLSTDFVLQFNRATSWQREKHAWRIRDYLDQTIHYSLWLVDNKEDNA